MEDLPIGQGIAQGLEPFGVNRSKVLEGVVVHPDLVIEEVLVFQLLDEPVVLVEVSPDAVGQVCVERMAAQAEVPVKMIDCIVIDPSYLPPEDLLL